MKKLIFLMIVVGLLGVADVGTRRFAEAELAAKVERSVQGSAGVDVDIDSFPFTAQLLATGEVPRLDLRVERLSGRSLELTDTLVRLEGVVIDKSRLTSGKAEVKSIERGTVALTIEASALASLVPDEVDLVLEGGRLQASFRGREVAAATVEISEEGALELTIPPLPVVSIVLPGRTLFPCRPNAELVGREMRLRCSFDEVPPALLRVANQVG